MVDWTQLSAVDWGIVVVLSLSMLLSLWRGFVREAVSLAGWVVAFVIANLYANELASVLAQWIQNITGRYVAAYGLLFAGTLVLAGILAKVSAQVVKVTGLSLLDRLLGTAFGLARGIIIVLVAVYFLRHLVPPQELQWLDQSQLMPHLDMLAQWVRSLFYDYNSGSGNGLSI
jgi:membrane protein required for colicin V production